MLTVVTLLWGANQNSRDFSSMYDESWAEKLYRGFARNLTVPFRFVCYGDREWTFSEPIEQVRLKDRIPGYSSCIQPYEQPGPMILVGLDTLIVGNIDHLARSAAERSTLGLPRDPYKPERACNGVALVPPGYQHVASDHEGENDMEHVRCYPHGFLDDEFPGQVVSWKAHVERFGVGDARIIYFHGKRKMDELTDHPVVREHWR